jgi:hypothetical protein
VNAVQPPPVREIIVPSSLGDLITDELARGFTGTFSIHCFDGAMESMEVVWLVKVPKRKKLTAAKASP